MRDLILATQTFPIQGSFRIAHGSVNEISVVIAEIHQGGYIGRGECRPYARYNETPQSVIAQIEAIREDIESGLSLKELQTLMPAGAARNAVDCALWDLKAKISKEPVWAQLGLSAPTPRPTAYTLSIDTPDAMAKAALGAMQYHLLKIKIGDMSGLDSALAILDARKDVSLIIDANEALTPKELVLFRETLAAPHIAPRIVMIEQPLCAKIVADHVQDPKILPALCADESLHGIADLPLLWSAGYRAVNVKLDKTGGVSAGFELMRTAKGMGFTVMAGCMVGTSLAMAPMLHLASLADVIDLDGPALLARDRPQGVQYKEGKAYPPNPKLWG